MNEVIPERIRFCRKKNKLNQQELAEKVGVSTISIKRWENSNDKRVPNSSIMSQIAKVLNTSVAFLMGETDDSEIHNNKNSYQHTTEQNTTDDEQHSLSYWGKVVDNMRKLAKSSDRDEISLIYTLLKSGFEKLEQAKNLHEFNDETNFPNVNIRQNNFGRDATVNLGAIQATTTM
ncbi:MAG: helix-turn-helix transcriptional regulator [Synergistaceae bacterium]|nr:helix-turn-helix transcriptional regulator [Synergistaceae bacterium]